MQVIWEDDMSRGGKVTKLQMNTDKNISDTGFQRWEGVAGQAIGRGSHFLGRLGK